MEYKEKCVICKQPAGDGDSSLEDNKGSARVLHKDCRCENCNPHQIAKDTKEDEHRHILRASDKVKGFSSRQITCSVANQSRLK